MSQGTATSGTRPPRDTNTSPNPGSKSPGSGQALQKYLDNHVARLQADIDATTRKMELERRNLHELKENLRRSKEEYEEKRVKYGAPKGSIGEELKRSQTNNKISEIKLSQQVQNLNNTNDENNRIRNEINRQRQETQNLNGVKQRVASDYASIDEQVQAKQKEVDRMVASNIECQEEIDQLRRQIRENRDFYRHEIETTKMEVLKADRLAKEQDIQTTRDMSAAGESPARRLEHRVTDEEMNFDEQRVRASILRSSVQNLVNRSAIRDLDARTAMLQDAMAQIREATSMEEADEIVKEFLEYEKRNYSALTYHAELQKEFALLTAKVREMREVLEGHDEDEQEDSQRRQEALAALRVQIEQTQRNLELKEKELWYAEGFLTDAAPLLREVCEVLEGKWVDGSASPSYLTRTQAFQAVVNEEVGQAALSPRDRTLVEMAVDLVEQKFGSEKEDATEKAASRPASAKEEEAAASEQKKEEETAEGSQKAASEKAASEAPEGSVKASSEVPPATPAVVASVVLPADSELEHRNNDIEADFLRTGLTSATTKGLNTTGRPTRAMLAPGPSQLEGGPDSVDVVPLLRFLERYMQAHKAYVDDLVNAVISRPGSAALLGNTLPSTLAAANLRLTLAQETKQGFQQIAQFKAEVDHKLYLEANPPPPPRIRGKNRFAIAAALAEAAKPKPMPHGVPSDALGRPMPGRVDPYTLPEIKVMMSDVKEENTQLTREELRQQALEQVLKTQQLQANDVRESLRARTLRKAEAANFAGRGINGFVPAEEKVRGEDLAGEKAAEEAMLAALDRAFDEEGKDFEPAQDSRPATASRARDVEDVQGLEGTAPEKDEDEEDAAQEEQEVKKEEAEAQQQQQQPMVSEFSGFDVTEAVKETVEETVEEVEETAAEVVAAAVEVSEEAQQVEEQQEVAPEAETAAAAPAVDEEALAEEAKKAALEAAAAEEEAARLKALKQATQVTVNVKVLSALGVRAADGDTSDPYCSVEVLTNAGVSVMTTKDQKPVETEVVKKTVNPVWNASFALKLTEAALKEKSLNVRFRVFDRDTFSKDDFLGEVNSRVALPLHPKEGFVYVQASEIETYSLPLRDNVKLEDKEKAAGTLSFEVQLVSSA